MNVAARSIELPAARPPSADPFGATYEEFVLPPARVADEPSRQAVEAACAKVVSSRTFAQSARHRAFLRHVVRAVLEGRAACLKEVSIGREIFERALNGYDPNRDSIVRVEARRLRLKLQRYYDDEGRGDPLEIRLPIGSYAPVFAARRPSARPAPGGPLLLVLPFVMCGDGLVRSAERIATDVALADQLIDLFGAQPGLRVVAPIVAATLRERALAFETLRRTHAIDYVVDGSIVVGGSRMRCVAHLSRTRDGLRLWSGRFETEPAAGIAATCVDDPFAFQDRVATGVVAAVMRASGAA